MIAATFIKPYSIKPLPFKIGKPNFGEVLVKVHKAGICGSDLAIVSGQHPRARPPMVVGHEFSGEIVELGNNDDNHLQIGSRVTVFPLLVCGNCYACRNKFSHVCSTLRLIGFDRTGGMAEYVTVPIDLIVPLPDNIDYEIGALIEPLAVCIHAISMSKVQVNDTVFILGAGPIGLLTAMLLRQKGVKRLYISDIDSFRLNIARDLGINALNSNDSDILCFANEQTEGNLADMVFEVAGVQSTADQMTKLVRPRGSIINVSVFKKAPVVDMRAVNFKELRVIGTRVYTREDYKKALQIAPNLPLNKIITHRLPLTEVESAFEVVFKQKQVCKILLDCSS